MAKADIKQAYRIVPVHPDDRHLLCVQWGVADKVLPFGLRSAPLIALADALQWIMGVHPVAHYLDDFITLGPPHSPQCSQSREHHPNLQLHGHSLGGEQMRGPFLGMELDSTRMSPSRQTSSPNGIDAGRALDLQHASTPGPLFLTEADHTFHSGSTS